MRKNSLKPFKSEGFRHPSSHLCLLEYQDTVMNQGFFVRIQSISECFIPVSDVFLTCPVVCCSDEPRSPAERVRYILSDDKTHVSSDKPPELALRGLFCQMDALCHFDTGDTGWKEAARYVLHSSVCLSVSTPFVLSSVCSVCPHFFCVAYIPVSSVYFRVLCFSDLVSVFFLSCIPPIFCLF